MTWTANKNAAIFENGMISVPVTFTSDGKEQPFERVYRTEMLSADWPDADIRAKLDALNSMDLSSIGTGAPNPESSLKTTPPTQDEIDQAAWIDAVRNWRRLKTIVDGGLSKTVTQADVDAAYAVVKSTYKDAYADLAARLLN